MTTRYAIGLDVGGTNARAALVRLDPQPTVTAEAEARIRGRTAPDQVAKTIAALVEQCREAAGSDVAREVPVGIGLAGQMSRDGRRIFNAPNLGWRDELFAARLERELNVSSVAICNDLSAIVIGEHRCGAAQGAADVLAVYVGTGIGSGIITDGRLVSGAGGSAGEIGHVKVRGLTAPCGCGQAGCIESLAGGKALDERIQRELNDGHAEDLRPWLLPGVALPAAVDRAASAAKPYAVALWDEVSDALGDVIAAAVSLLNPGTILLGGGVLAGCPELRRRLVERVSARAVAAAMLDARFVEPALGDRAGRLGAALLAAEHHSS